MGRRFKKGFGWNKTLQIHNHGQSWTDFLLQKSRNRRILKKVWCHEKKWHNGRAGIGKRRFTTFCSSVFLFIQRMTAQNIDRNGRRWVRLSTHIFGTEACWPDETSIKAVFFIVLETGIN
jgi:hypothetical protein